MANSLGAIARGRPPVVPDSVRRLIEGTSMLRSKVKALVAVLLVGGLVASTGAIAGRGDNPAPKKPPAKEVEKPAEATAAATANGQMRITVLDPDGKPVPGANVHGSTWTEEPGFKANQDVPTDAAGVAVINLPKTYSIHRLWASKKGLASLYAGWEQNELAGGRGVPAEYTFRLGKTTTAGGRVVDGAGRPIAGAKVFVELAGEPSPP